jgi:hypothetical protein
MALLDTTSKVRFNEEGKQEGRERSKEKVNKLLRRLENTLLK